MIKLLLNCVALLCLVPAGAMQVHVAGAGPDYADDFPMSSFADSAPQDINEDRPFLSSALGSNMVLQRAPQRAVVWGFAAPGTVVKTTLDGSAAMTTTADDAGVWRQHLPAVEASAEPHALAFEAATGEVARLNNVLFGDVYLCGGQSNMQFTSSNMENASSEAREAYSFPLIRVFTVGTGTSSGEPLVDLRTVMQRWSVANQSSIAPTAKGYFSAVCWIFGLELFKSLGGSVPIGLVSSNWGGSPIETWSPPESVKSCEEGWTNRAGLRSTEDRRSPPRRSTEDSERSVDHYAVGANASHLYNAMIHPFTVGPMALTGFTWYQGEADTSGWQPYTCLFPAMISAWRQAFRRPEAYFGFVQLSTTCPKTREDQYHHFPLAEMRTLGQMSAASLPKVGYVTNADHGDGCNVHPPAKQYCGRRLARSALALQYNFSLQWRSPSFKSQVAVATPPSMIVKLRDVSKAGVRTDQYPFNWLGGKFDCMVEGVGDMCAWAELQLPGGRWVNASIAAEGPTQLRLTAPKEYARAGAPLASRYGWANVPMMSVYDRQTDLPLLPWYETGDWYES